MGGFEIMDWTEKIHDEGIYIRFKHGCWVLAMRDWQTQVEERIEELFDLVKKGGE